MGSWRNPLCQPGEIYVHTGGDQLRSRMHGLGQRIRPKEIERDGNMLAVSQDRSALLERVHRWLRPHGIMTITDIVAGPDLSDEDRASLWEQDGINSLPFQVDSLAQIRDVGFQDLEVTDITHTVVTLQETILQESYRHKTALVDAVGADSWLAWVKDARNYRRLFAERKLVGLRIGTHRA